MCHDKLLCRNTAPTADPTPTPLNGCGNPCADVVTISSTSFPLIDSGTCYVVDGTFPSKYIFVPLGVDCAKITIPTGSTIDEIDAHLPRPSFCPAKRETWRAQVLYSENVEVVIHGKVNHVSARLPRPLLFALRGPYNTTSRRSRAMLPERRSRTPTPIPGAAWSISERAPCVPPSSKVSTPPSRRSSRPRPRSR